MGALLAEAVHSADDGVRCSVHAITAKISPEPGSSGLEVLEADTFTLNCQQTLTGVKFLVVTTNNHPYIDTFMRRLYELYADYVLKNPFYTPEMPIRCQLFDANLVKLVGA